MKATTTLVLLAALGSSGILAQAQELQTATASNSLGATASQHVDSVVAPDKDPSVGKATLGKNWQVTSPLVPPSKAQGLRQFPGRLLHLINPFAKKEAQSDTATRSAPSDRAWTTTVGWNPGGSAFADPVTHEPGLAVFSVKGTSAK